MAGAKVVRFFRSPVAIAFGVLFGSGLLQAAEVLFASYNLQNYFTSDRVSLSETIHAKPEKAIAAQIRILTQLNPDLLGVCEMGTPEDFEDFKSRLKGLGYQDFEYVNGPDQERHLALLSRFPISARNSRNDIPYQLAGVPEKVKRGILDVTIQISREYAIRCIGIHLKSKLAASGGEALMRRQEAHLLREHLNRVLKESPGIPLLVYGDFNDTKNEPAIQEILGPRGSPLGLRDLWLKDPYGDRWTYYWKQADVYSRIDFLFTSPALFRKVVRSGICRSQDWNEASDHRPIYATLDPARE